MPDKQLQFSPDYTPDELKAMGVYGEVYGPKDAPRLASLPEWPEHWYNEADPHGWLQWYNRYSKGRRIEDDTRQIKRWAAFKARHGGKMFQENPTPRRAFALRNWAIDPVKLLKDNKKRKELEMAMEQYRAKKYKTASEINYIELLQKFAKEKPGLWANIRAKRARGEKPAKPGDEGYPDKDQWKRLTSKKGALQFSGYAPLYKRIIKQLGGARSGIPIAVGAGLGGLGTAGLNYNTRLSLERAQSRTTNEKQKSNLSKQLKDLPSPLASGIAGAILGGAGGGLISKQMLEGKLSERIFQRELKQGTRDFHKKQKAWEEAWKKSKAESDAYWKAWEERQRKRMNEDWFSGEKFNTGNFRKENFDTGNFGKGDFNRGNSGRSDSGKKRGFSSFFTSSKVEKAKSFFGIGNAKTKDEAKAAYKNLVKQHHPDLGGDERTMKEVNNHWDNIKDSSWFQKLAFEAILKRQDIMKNR